MSPARVLLFCVALVLPGLAASSELATAPDAKALFGEDIAVETLAGCEAAFSEAGLKGAFVLYEPHRGRVGLCDPARAALPALPASTFKIFNALVALETGAIADEHEVFRWDGVRRRVESWNADHDLASGMRVSAVWYYQALARRIGAKRMQDWLTRAGYGNTSIAGGIDRFWLDGGLRISPLEQVLFLRRLREGSLPFSARSQGIVRDITLVESGEAWTLHAKTGWADSTDPDTGWYVGWVERGGEAYYFALNVDLRVASDAPKRLTLARRLLVDEDVMTE